MSLAAGRLLSKEQIRESLSSSDVLIRSTAILKATDKQVVEEACVDDSGLVRALAIRRLGLLSDMTHTMEREA
jgi:hypothetical protein